MINFKTGQKVDVFLYGDTKRKIPFDRAVISDRGDKLNDPDVLRLALNDYTKAIQLSPGTSEYLVNRGAVYIKINMFDNALQDFNAAERIDPTDHYIYHNRSTIYINLEEYDKAGSGKNDELDIHPSPSEENATIDLDFSWIGGISMDREGLGYFGQPTRLDAGPNWISFKITVLPQ